MTYLHSLTVRLLTSAVLVILPGCIRTVYELQLTPDGEAMHRKLIVSHEPKPANSDGETSPLSPAELVHMREFYDPKLEQIEDGKHSFAGVFRNELPADVGGAGRYAFLESPLGSTSLYSERFRGEDDLQQVMQKRNDAVDSLIDLLINWSRDEFAGQPVQARIEGVLDQDVRRDLKNLSIYSWTIVAFDASGENAPGKELAARVGMYLMERDYFSLADLPDILRVFGSQDGQAMAELFQRIVIRKLKVSDDESAVASLAILRDPERFANSLRESIRKTDVFQTELEKYRLSRGLELNVTVDDNAFDPLGLVTQNAFEVLLPNVGARLQVRVALNSDVKPFATNAVWNSDQNVLEWSENVAEDDIPSIMFAVWSVPDADFQEQCFGQIILADEPLAQFVYWYRGLTEGERQQYDSFLATLSPGSDLIAKIDAYEFVEEEKLADLPRSLFKQAIEKAQ